MTRPNEGAVPAGTLPQTVRRDFSGLGYAEAMRRARGIVPILRERAAKAEDARMLIRDNEQLLTRERAVALSPAKGIRRNGTRLRGGRRHPGARARLPVDRLECRQPRLSPLDPRILPARDPTRGV